MAAKETKQEASQECTVSQGRRKKALQESRMVALRDRREGEMRSCSSVGIVSVMRDE